MATPDRDRERITAVYAGMSDEELQRIAQSGDQLTEVAQAALNAEMARRSLSIDAAPSPQAGIPKDLTAPVALPPDTQVVDMNRAFMLRRFRDLPEALLAKGSLESAGIAACLVDDNMIRMDWFISNLLGGVKLFVHPEDAESAEEILNQPIPEDIEIEGVGSYRQPTCPQCQSLDVNYQELNKFLSYGSAGLGIPIPVHKKAWTCHACRHEWEEAEPESHVEPDPPDPQI